MRDFRGELRSSTSQQILSELSLRYRIMQPATVRIQEYDSEMKILLEVQIVEMTIWNLHTYVQLWNDSTSDGKEPFYEM